MLETSDSYNVYDIDASLKVAITVMYNQGGHFLV